MISPTFCCIIEDRIDRMGDKQMGNMDSMDRERKKRQLRQRMISSPGGQKPGGGRSLDEEEIVRKAEAHTRKKKI